ncbi:universal stress protein [Pseudohaliea rubra]|uniref:Universal stress protein E n=1 Tax=Pseudohaliea rubra DSM 19751 TaxID=1265313 RepID=A0A095VMT1_9GAMM|nr:universal stress protein [Pseudohaliea rubra]KGE02792.1 Universal stress protein E [Pseudohaliea rubra DSM 19751]
MNTIRRLLCVVRECDDRAVALLRHADALARSLQAELTLLNVLPELDPTLRLMPHAPPFSKLAEDRRTQRSGALTQLARQAGVNAHRLRLREGIFFIEVIREVVQEAQDLLITNAETAAGLRRFFSNEDLRLLRKCPCPVWLLRPERPPQPRRILVAVDCGVEYDKARSEINRKLNRSLVQHALALATANQADVHLVNAWRTLSESYASTLLSDVTAEEQEQFMGELQHLHEESMRSLLADLAREGLEQALSFVGPTTHVVRGEPREVVPALARELDADLVVMGTMARTGIAGFFMGNTAEAIIDQLHCSLLALKPDGYETPIAL